MGFTYTWQNIADEAQKFIKGVPVTAIDSQSCDYISGLIWTAYPWAWTLKALTAIAWVDGTQDYTITDADFYRMVHVRFVRTDLTPDMIREKEMVESLAPELATQGGIESISLVSVFTTGVLGAAGTGGVTVTNKLRLEMAASVPSGTTIQIQGEYQPLPFKIVDSTAAGSQWNLADKLWIPDHYASVALEGVKWRFYQFADDTRAGNVVILAGRRQYTGQLGIFHDALVAMKEAEDYGDAGPFTFPLDPLGAVGSSYPSIYGG